MNFEEHREHLTAVAYRMLGSLAEAQDAVQETWLRLHRADTGEVTNPGGWLTTVVSRVCLDMLRSRAARREEPIGAHEAPADDDPERAAVLADSVGLAMLVVLDALAPAERVAFVLHDMFAVPFADIGQILDRSPAATKQLASRARTRIRGTSAVPAAELGRQRKVLDAFLAAARHGDFQALVAVLDPDIVLHTDGRQIRGAEAVARQALKFSGRSGASAVALVDGAVGLVVAPQGRLRLSFRYTFADGRITTIDIIGEPERLAELRFALPPAQP